MQRTYSRRYRPRASVTCEGKKGCHENFFGDPEQDRFFQPSIYSTQASTIHPIHRKCAECEAEEKQVHRMAATPCAPMSMGAVSRYVTTLPGKGAPLPAPARQFFETRMGHDFSGVRIHTGEEAAQSASALQAKAYTTGNEIVFAQGQYDTTSGEGKRLLAHELVHVIQQGAAGSLGGKVDRRIDRKVTDSKPSDTVDLAEMFYRISAHEPGAKYFSNTEPFVNGQSAVGGTSLLKVPGAADLHTENKKGQFESTVVKHDPTEVTYQMELPTQPKQWVADKDVSKLPDLFNGLACQVRRTRIVIDGQPDVKTVHDKSEIHEGQHVKDLKELDNTIIDKYDKEVMKIIGHGTDAPSSRQDATDQAGKLAEAAWTEFTNEFNNRSLDFHNRKDKSGDQGHFTEPTVAPDCRLVTAKAYHVR